MRISVCLTALVVALSCAAIAEAAEVTIWTIPVKLTNLFDISPAWADGQVFVALPGAYAVALVDGLIGEVRLLPVGQAPLNLLLTEEGLFFTFHGGIGFVDPETGKTTDWEVPKPVGKVDSLVEGEFGTGVVTLWFSQGSPDKLGVFEPTSISPALPDKDESEALTLDPVRLDVSASVIAVEPAVHSLEDPLLFRTMGSYEGEFRRWTPFVRSRGVDRLAIGSNAYIWFSQGGDTLFLFEPWSGSMFRHKLPDGAKAGAVTVSPSGAIWYIDSAQRSVGRLDSSSNVVTTWSLPQGGQPFDIAIGDSGDVWISDRASGVIYRLDPERGEFSGWQIGSGLKPSILCVDSSGTVWFIEETKKAVGRLTRSES